MQLFRYLFPLYTQCGCNTQAACTSIIFFLNPANKRWYVKIFSQLFNDYYYIKKYINKKLVRDDLTFLKMFSHFFNNYYSILKIQLVRDDKTFYKMFSQFFVTIIITFIQRRHPYRLSSSLSYHVRLTGVFSRVNVRVWTLYVVPTVSLVPKPFEGR